MLFLPVLASEAGGKPDPMEHVIPHPLFGGFNNHHLMGLVVLVVGIALLALVAKKMPVKGGSAEDYVTKGRFTQFMEVLLIFIRDEMTRPLLGDLTDRYIKYIWSTFFFILFANVFGLIPTGAILDLVGLHSLSHWGGTITGNVNITAGLAGIACFMMFFVGLKENGFHFIQHMWPVPVTPPEGVKGFMLVIVMPILWLAGIIVFALEFVGYFIKSFALCVRLFANMVAGHLVLGSLIIMAMYAGVVGKTASGLGAAAFSFLELFVAFLQAYIFTFLTVIFISLGAISHAEHDEHHAGLDEGDMPGDDIKEGMTGTTTVGAH